MRLSRRHVDYRPGTRLPHVGDPPARCGRSRQWARRQEGAWFAMWSLELWRMSGSVRSLPINSGKTMLSSLIDGDCTQQPSRRLRWFCDWDWRAYTATPAIWSRRRSATMQ